MRAGAVAGTDERERIATALCEACAARGYDATSVEEICERAGVSTAAFHRLYESKLECMIETHGRLLDRLLSASDLACSASVRPEPEERARVCMQAGLTLLAAYPAAARLLTVEIAAAGPEGLRRYDDALGEVAARIGRARPGGIPARQGTDWARAATLAILVAEASISERAAERLGTLDDEFLPLVVASGD